MPDSILYETLARNIIEGKGYINMFGEQEFLRTPGYPLFVASLFSILDSPAFVIIVQIILLVLTGVLIYKMTQFLGYNQNSGFIAILLFSLSGIVMVQVLFLISETLYTFFLTLFFYLILRYEKSEDIKLLILSAIPLGFAALTRPIAIYFIIILISILLFFKRNWKRTILNACVFFLVFLLIISPWLYRNYSLTNKLYYSSVSDIMIIIYAYPVYGEINNLDYHQSTEGILKEASQFSNWSQSNYTLFGDNGIARESPEKIAQARNYALRYILAHPFIYAKYHLLGIATTFLPNTVNEFSYIIEGTNRYGLNIQILMNIFNIQFIQDNLLYILFKFYELLLAFLAYILAIVGFVKSVKMKKNHFIVTLMICWVIYNVNLTSTYGLDRYSVPLLPLIVVVSAIGFSETDWRKLLDNWLRFIRKSYSSL